MIQIPLWKFKQIENSLRITHNAYSMRTKETCLFREMCKSYEYAQEALAKAETSESGLNIDIVSGMLPTSEEINYEPTRRMINNLENYDTISEAFTSGAKWMKYRCFKAVRNYR